MDKIQIANILLTRRCNLRCDYCSIVRDYEDMPKLYPNMKHYRDNELTSTKWIEIIDKLVLNNPNVFLIFYGGEPFLYNGLTDIIKHCHARNVYYTIISNNTEEIQPKILQLYKDVGKIRGFSASVDPELYGGYSSRKDHAIDKTIAGFKNLCLLKSQGIAEDVVAEMTVTSQNYTYLYDTVKILSENNIYSSITTIDLKKSNYYDFSTIKDEHLLVHKNEGVAKQFMDIMSDSSLKVHIPEMLIKLYGILPCEMKCAIHKDLHNVTVDSDGTFRLCLRIRGVEFPKLKLNEIFSDSDKMILPAARDAIKNDYNSLCRGCNHTCLLFSKYFSDGIVTH